MANLRADPTNSNQILVDGNLVINSTVPIAGAVNENDMASDSETLVPTQKSVKTYIGNNTVKAYNWLNVTGAGGASGNFTFIGMLNDKPAYQNNTYVAQGFADSTLNAILSNLMSVHKCEESSGALLDERNSWDLDTYYTTGTAPNYHSTGKSNYGIVPRDYGFRTGLITGITGAATLNLWLKPSNSTASLKDAIVVEDSAGKWVGVRINTTSKRFYLYTSAAGVSGTYVSYTAGNFYNLNISFNGTNTFTLTVNSGSAITVSVPAGFSAASGLRIHINNGHTDTYHTYDELTMWNRELSTGGGSELAALYNSGTGKFYVAGTNRAGIYYTGTQWKAVEDYGGTNLPVIDTATAGTEANPVDATWSTIVPVIDPYWVIDEDDMASDFDDALPTQQSVKAYTGATFSAKTHGLDSITDHTGFTSFTDGNLFKADASGFCVDSGFQASNDSLSGSGSGSVLTTQEAVEGLVGGQTTGDIIVGNATGFISSSGTKISDITNLISGLTAGDIAYTPGDGADWTDPDPTTITAALDRIAAAVAGLLGGSIP